MTEIRGRIEKANLESKVMGTGSIFSYMRIPWGKGWVLVGDSGMAFDPWSGQGIDQACAHAVILADCLTGFLDGDTDWDTAMRDFHSARNDFSKKAYRQTSIFGKDLRPMTRAALDKRGL